MKSDLLHRIDALEAEALGELDLRAVASTPMPRENWADPARTDLSAVGFESAQPALTMREPAFRPTFDITGPHKRRRRFNFRRFGWWPVVVLALIAWGVVTHVR